MRHASATLVMGLVLTASVTAAGTPVNEKRPATPGGSVEVENVAGSVEVSGWSAPELEVTGTLGKGTERLEISGDAGRLRVRVVLPDPARDVGDSHLTIRMPSSSQLEVDAVSATITVRELSGGLDLASVSGTVTVHGQPSALEVEAVSSDIVVDEAPAGSELASVSGRVAVGRANGRLEATSVSGDIDVAAGTLGDAELTTTSGDIECAVDLAGTGTVELETMSGAVVLTLPAAVQGSFELSTFSGAIRSALGPAPQRTSEYAPGEELEFSLGTGPTVKASSFSGSVTLKTR